MRTMGCKESYQQHEHLGITIVHGARVYQALSDGSSIGHSSPVTVVAVPFVPIIPLTHQSAYTSQSGQTPLIHPPLCPS